MNILKWNTLQQEQIDLGRSAGLSRRQIRLYKRHCFSFLQMQEIRTALEEGIDAKDVRMMCRPWLSDTDMEKIRLRLENGEKLRRRTDLKTVCAFTALIVLAAALITDGYVRASEHVYLELSRPYVTLAAGESFEPMKYVADYSEQAEAISLPSGIDTSVPGVQAAVYRLRSGKEEITRILLVTVEDSEKE